MKGRGMTKKNSSIQDVMTQQVEKLLELAERHEKSGRPRQAAVFREHAQELCQEYKLPASLLASDKEPAFAY
jgi:hypothetical protein